LSSLSNWSTGLRFPPLAELLNRFIALSIQPAGCQLHRCAGHPIPQVLEHCASQETGMLWTVFAILLLLWLLGWGFHVAGSLIHLILVIALVVLVIELITGRRATV
jgi:hypothetical protein